MKAVTRRTLGRRAMRLNIPDGTCTYSDTARPGRGALPVLVTPRSFIAMSQVLGCTIRFLLFMSTMFYLQFYKKCQCAIIDFYCSIEKMYYNS